MNNGAFVFDSVASLETSKMSVVTRRSLRRFYMILHIIFLKTVTPVIGQVSTNKNNFDRFQKKFLSLQFIRLA